MKDTNIGYIVQVETYFPDEALVSYETLDENTDVFAYKVTDILGSGYDHFTFLNGEPHNPKLLGEVKAFIKKLRGMGIPADVITYYKITK